MDLFLAANVAPTAVALGVILALILAIYGAVWAYWYFKQPK